MFFNEFNLCQNSILSLLFSILSLPVPAAEAALKPLTMRVWDKCSTTMLPALVAVKSTFLNGHDVSVMYTI
jgi:hypothetical protein